METNIDDLLAKMTLQEKVSLLGGADAWHTTAIARLGIPALKVTDGPNGARGERFTDGIAAACFPVGIALASTWNTELIAQVGQAIAQDAKTKGARVLLAPTFNIHRSPLNGRNFECMSEDPYLSGKMATAYVKGVQSEGVGATPKHYVCNDSEFERNSISSEVEERALREIYLKPFEMVVRDAQPWALMSSYNKINGTFASENTYTLTDILRNEWGFDGVVVSDWFGTYSTAASTNAGLDLEMPGPAVFHGEKLLQAVERGEVGEQTINERVRHILRLLVRTGIFEHPEEAPEQALDRPVHRAVARQAAAEGAVLLKNAGDVLPLPTEKLQSLAIIGPNAKTARIMGGGSAQLKPHYAITPFDGIMAKLGQQVKVGYELGCTNHKMLPALDVNTLNPVGDETTHGMTAEFFSSTDLSGPVIHTEQTRTTELMWFGFVAKEVNIQQFSARLTGRFTPTETGTYSLGLASAGLSRLFLDEQEVIDNWTKQAPGDLFIGMGSAEATYEVALTAGRSYTLRIEYSKNSPFPLGLVRLGGFLHLPADAIERAAKLAAESDVAVVFVGLNGEWESEGYDRPNIDLVGKQNELVEQVAAANKNTIVVLQSGSPLAMPWLDKVASVVQAWYPGQECGNGIADVLFGDVNPSGKLTETFPVRLEDNPAYINYPGENGKVHYGEGLFVGYRYYEKKKVEPLFPFGFGLSYTTFDYSNLRLSTNKIRQDETLQVMIDIANMGKRAGQEVVQLYVRDVASKLMRPEKELKDFAKIQLEPGEHKTVTFELSSDALAYYDDLVHAWVAESGEFEVLIGASSADIREKAGFTLA